LGKQVGERGKRLVTFHPYHDNELLEVGERVLKKRIVSE